MKRVVNSLNPKFSVLLCLMFLAFVVTTFDRKDHAQWVMPDRNYTSQFVSIETGEVLASIVHIDTNTMIRLYREAPENAVMPTQLDLAPSAESQIDWVRSTLKSLDGVPGYKFVIGHHPVETAFNMHHKDKMKVW